MTIGEKIDSAKDKIKGKAERVAGEARRDDPTGETRRDAPTGQTRRDAPQGSGQNPYDPRQKKEGVKGDVEDVDEPETNINESFKDR